ncbi:hypothetical protein ACCI51_18740 [Microbulbifer echini]|uniref:GH16 domain-containing protein n=1 Tax=Microbulbifer echini TaxID=1529067 RepID=A0ABV4NSR1_9GAMM
MHLKKSVMLFTIVTACAPLSTTAKTQVWQDNFGGVGINRSVWTYDVGNSGWGNNELQNYTDDNTNAYIENGNLVIQALRNTDGSFSSARLKTLGRLSYKYGTIEARIKLPDLDTGL